MAYGVGAAAKRQFGDLGRAAQPVRRIEVAGAATDVQAQGFDAVQASDVRLERAHQPRHREALPAVQVAGQLQIDAVGQRGRGRARAMRQQQARRSLGGPAQRRIEIGEMGGARVDRHRVNDADDDQRSVAMTDDAVFVEQHVDTDAAEGGNR